MLPHPSAPSSILSVPEKFSEEQIDNIADVNQLCCQEESGQWLANVVRTHLVLATGKLALQKREAAFLSTECGPEASSKALFSDECLFSGYCFLTSFIFAQKVFLFYFLIKSFPNRLGPVK